MTATSVSLLERLRSPAGEDAPEAWRRLIALYGPLIRYWLRQNAALAPDADDLVQEVLTVLVRRIGGFEHNGRRGAFRVWLRTTTRQCASGFYATRRNRPLATGGSGVPEALGELASVDSPLSRRSRCRTRLVGGRRSQALPARYSQVARSPPRNRLSGCPEPRVDTAFHW